MPPQSANFRGLVRWKVSDMEQFTVSCEWCLIEFDTEWDTKKYCCREHKERAKQFRKTGKSKVSPELRTATPIYPRSCPSCEHSFIARLANHVYCSNDCSYLARERRKEAVGIHKRQKKSPSLKARVYFRDSGECQICHQSIDTTIKYPDPLSLSLDHILPRSQGGTDAQSNLRATHLVCNVRRGDGTQAPTRAYESYIATQQP